MIKGLILPTGRERQVEFIKYFSREDKVQEVQRRLYQGYKFVVSTRGTVIFPWKLKR